MRSGQNHTPDYARYFLKRQILRLDLQHSNADSLKRKGKKIPNIEPWKGKGQSAKFLLSWHLEKGNTSRPRRPTDGKASVAKTGMTKKETLDVAQSNVFLSYLTIRTLYLTAIFLLLSFDSSVSYGLFHYWWC